MKAIIVHQFGGPEVMKLEETPDPQPASDQVVVRIRAAGVNPVDTYIRSGAYTKTPALPYTPGIDAAGVVESAGSDVKRVKAGDRVYLSGALSGTYAELALCKESQVHPLPYKISFSQGAAINVPYATAYRALFQRGRAAAGETVLIHGASGGVGIAAVQFARAAGLIVIGTGGTEKGRKLISEQGAHHVLDHTAPGCLEQVLALTDNQGVDVIVEMLANVNLGKDLPLLARSGRVVVVGSRGSVEINARDAMTRDANILGMSLMNAPEHELTGIYAAIFAGLENGTLVPIVGQEMPLADAPRSHEEVLKPGAYGKIVLIP